MLVCSARDLLLGLAALLAAPGDGAAQQPVGQATSEAPDASAARPNIVLIVADDLGADQFGCYGNQRGLTPRIDQLASEGLRFETCYSTPLCRPSRVLLLTGQYGFRTGFLGNDRRYKPAPGTAEADIGRHTTFADALSAAGYATGLAGKWHLSGAVPGLVFECGFDEYLIWGSFEHLPQVVRESWQGSVITARYWHPVLLENGSLLSTEPDDYGPDRFTEWGIDFMRRHRDERFLLYYPMCLAHAPLEETPDPARPGQRVPASLDAYVAYTDHLVGRLADAVEQLGLAGRTVFVFTTDNGTQDLGKGQATELGARVPLIVRWPGRLPPATVCGALTDHSDVLPTLAELGQAGLPGELELDGQSLVPTLLDPERPHREWIFSYVDTERVLRTERWLWESGSGLYDCGSSRDGSGYRHVLDGLEWTASDAEVEAARRAISAIAARLPAPEKRADDPQRLRDRWKDDPLDSGQDESETANQDEQ